MTCPDCLQPLGDDSLERHATHRLWKHPSEWDQMQVWVDIEEAAEGARHAHVAGDPIGTALALDNLDQHVTRARTYARDAFERAAR